MTCYRDKLSTCISFCRAAPSSAYFLIRNSGWSWTENFHQSVELWMSLRWFDFTHLDLFDKKWRHNFGPIFFHHYPNKSCIKGAHTTHHALANTQQLDYYPWPAITPLQLDWCSSLTGASGEQRNKRIFFECFCHSHELLRIFLSCFVVLYESE